MPAGPRIRGNNSFGVTTDNPLTAGAITFNSAGLVTLPVVSAAHAVVVLDPKRVFGEPEIVVVTTHTAAATVATITRGQYGTVARSHPQGTAWAHVPVDEDYIEILTSITRPSDPYRGQMIFESDTNAFFGRSTADAWQNINMFADPPACRVFHNAAQSIADNTLTTVAFNSERWDTAGMHDTVTNNSRITFPTAGLYVITYHTALQAAADYAGVIGYIRVGGADIIARQSLQCNAVSLEPYISMSTVYRFAANEYIEGLIYHDNTANAARNLISFPFYSPEFSATWIGRG